MRILKSLLRVCSILVCVLFLALIATWVALRQPNWGEIAVRGKGHADRAALKRHVIKLCTTLAPRNYQNRNNLLAVVAYLKAQFETAGATVEVQEYDAQIGATGKTRQTNIIARIGPAQGARVVVGAHYDTFGELPGADDNASGVAGLLELARLLGMNPPQGSVELVAYSTEEPPFYGSPQMGSAVHAESLAQNAVDVKAMLCLEMIGYFIAQQPDKIPGLRFVYPRHGYFAAVVGRWQDRRLARTVKKGFRGITDLPIYSYSGPTRIGADLSDHRNYWAKGYTAVMITDTAFLRNPHYHTKRDTPDTLDYGRMAQVVDGVFNTVLHLSRPERIPDR